VTRDISSLFSNLHIHFEQPFNREEPRPHYVTDAAVFSSQFPEGHQLNADFVKAYQLQDELGCGGYGFVMTALDRIEGQEVAVKFIVKAKVPDHAWMEDEAYGKLPTEVVLLSCINHENIVKCLGSVRGCPVFLHGGLPDLFCGSVQTFYASRFKNYTEVHGRRITDFTLDTVTSGKSSHHPQCLSQPYPHRPPKPHYLYPNPRRLPNYFCPSSRISMRNVSMNPIRMFSKPINQQNRLVHVLKSTRRSSHDLFECIEQSENKRLTEDQARYVFAQVADAVDYLDSLGIAHRDIKDENVVIDKDLKVKLNALFVRGSYLCRSDF
jgi:serine/threonine protein kinase